jgi:hypothetical protein
VDRQSPGGDLPWLSNTNDANKKQPSTLTDMVEVLYRCEKCATETQRLIKER